MLTPFNVFHKQNSISLILGAPDALTARICWDLGADFIWASSFVLSAVLGMRDDGMIDINRYLTIVEGLINASPAPVVLDFDLCGRDNKECLSQLNKIKHLRLGGICIEDESWPKVNAMLKSSLRKLISHEKMSQKIRIAKKVLDHSAFVVARTHSLIANEDVSELQNRIDSYTNAGADILCIHYTGQKWNYYKSVIKKLTISKPLMIIFSKVNFLPRALDYSKIKYILFPNQIYRMMLRPVVDLKNKQKKFDKCSIKFETSKLVDTKEIFDVFDKIHI